MFPKASTLNITRGAVLPVVAVMSAMPVVAVEYPANTRKVPSGDLVRNPSEPPEPAAICRGVLPVAGMESEVPAVPSVAYSCNVTGDPPLDTEPDV